MPPFASIRAVWSRSREERAPALDVESIYRDHGPFLWASLRRMGVREADLPDAVQEVLVVVHRNLERHDGECRVTSWLFGIALKVAAGQRRRAHVRREELRVDEHLHAEASPAPSPEDDAMRSEDCRRLEAVLDGVDPEKRAVFVMFELEGLSCAEIAELLDVPVGTVHSRLHAARKAFEQSFARLKAQERHTVARARGGGA